MRPAKFLAFSVLLAMATSLLATGCAAEDEVDARAEYPVGYTPPGSARRASATAQAVPAPPPPPYAPGGAPGQGQSVAVGSDEPSYDPSQEEGSPAAPVDGSGASAAAGYDDTDPSALTDFRTTLDPYGSWQDDPTYGTVWVPSRSVVGDDFTPYVSAGHWEYDDDYVWASDYSWGWAPFHYGRWVYGGPGWEWIPGRVYAGAWVSWRYGDDDWAYVGWAPLSPLWCWRGGFAVGLGYVPYAPYAFVGREYLFAPAVGTRVIVGAGVGAIGAHTRPWTGPGGAGGTGTGGVSGGAVAGGGRVLAHPTVGGPPPSTLHIQSASVMRASPSTAGLAQARAYARPSSAVALGARAPQGYAPANRGAFRGGSPYAAAGGRGSYSLGSSSMPSSPGSSHFGGKLGSGIVGSPSAAPAYSARPSYGYGYGRSASSYPSYRSSAPSFRGAAPSYHSPVSASPAPSFHGSPGGSSFHSGGSSSFGSGFHGGGGGGFHSGGGGGGGGHGGGHR